MEKVGPAASARITAASAGAAMNLEEFSIVEDEENWETVCERHIWNCSRCGEKPTYYERAIFFLRGLCGKCDFLLENGA